MTGAGFWSGKKVLVTGGGGFIGSYVVENLVKKRAVPSADVVVPRSSSCDLRRFDSCQRAVEGCQVVIHLAAVTGGISFSRNYPASQYYDSTLMDLHVVEAARQAGVQKLVAIGNVFAYAAQAPMPLKETSLFDGLPTDAHRGVGWLKRNLALVADLYNRQHQFAMAVVYSANAYGPGDSLDPVHSHVVPATIMKCFRDEDLVVWGDGSPTRDFLFVEDVAEGLLLAAEKLPGGTAVNIGSGAEISIRELVNLITRSAGFRRKCVFDASKSGGDARRCVDTGKAKQLMDFQPRVSIEEGMRKTVDWYREQLVAQAT